MASTGIEPFLDAVEQAILTAELANLVPGHRQERRIWTIALAWLARDQECRFDHVLDWRSTASDSDSPARGLNQTEKLDALRAFLQAITPEEQAKNLSVNNVYAQRHLAERDDGSGQVVECEEAAIKGGVKVGHLAGVRSSWS